MCPNALQHSQSVPLCLPLPYAGPFFRCGWGDIVSPMRVSRALLRSIEMNEPIVTPLAHLTWKAFELPTSTNPVRAEAWEGEFDSPQAALLPLGVKRCSFLLISPASVSADWRPGALLPTPSATASADATAQSASTSTHALPSPIVVLMPATGEETYDDRVRLGIDLVRQRGAVVIAVMAPFYGPRKGVAAAGGPASVGSGGQLDSREPPTSWLGRPLGNTPPTVGAFLSQSVAVIVEASECGSITGQACATSSTQEQ
jgi:hypothetical protein